MTAEEWLTLVQSDVRRQAEDEARLMALGKWPDGMPHSGSGCDLSGVADVLDRQPIIAEEVARARLLCSTLDSENPRHRWGRILECYYVDDLPIRKVAEVVGYAEGTVKNEKSTALDVMTERFFSPKVMTRNDLK
jgi:DNA-directed RNA polymerase specialized sigma24 family protein